MRRKYNDCQRADGDCTACSLVNYGRDCHNRPITKLEWARRMADMTQSELAQNPAFISGRSRKLNPAKSRRAIWLQKPYLRSPTRWV